MADWQHQQLGTQLGTKAKFHLSVTHSQNIEVSKLVGSQLRTKAKFHLSFTHSHNIEVSKLVQWRVGTICEYSGSISLGAPAKSRGVLRPTWTKDNSSPDILIVINSWSAVLRPIIDISYIEWNHRLSTICINQPNNANNSQYLR